MPALVLLLRCGLVALAVCAAASASGTITLASSYALGGETTLYAQTIAKYIEYYSGLRVNLTFVTGGNGANAMHWLTQQPADGLHVATAQMPFLVTLPMYSGCPYRLADISVISWSSYTPGVLFVHTNTTIYTWPQLLDAAEAAGGLVVPGVSQQFMHASLVRQCSRARHLRFQQAGASATLVQMLSNRSTSVVWGSPALYLMHRDIMRPIIMTSEVTPETLPRVPLFSQYGIDIRDGSDRGLAVSSRVPVETQLQLSQWIGSAAANVSFIHEIQALGFLPKYMEYPDTNAYSKLKYNYYHAFLFPKYDYTWVAATVPSVVGFLSVLTVVVSSVVVYQRKRRMMFEQFEKTMSRQALAMQSPATTVLTTLMEIQQFVPPALQPRLNEASKEAAVFLKGIMFTEGSNGSFDTMSVESRSLYNLDPKSSLLLIDQGTPWCYTHFEAIVAAAEKYTGWDYDPREANREFEGHLLQALLVFFFARMGLLEAMKVDRKTLCCWAEAVEDTYLPNPFHSQLHAADVVQATAFLLSLPGMSNVVTPEHAFVALVSAAAHDCAHPGRTNAFVVESRGDLAITYNDRSVLENHHLATFFRLCAVPRQNIFRNMSDGTCKALRKRIIETVLATDLAGHFSFINTLSNKLSVNFSPSTNSEDMCTLVCTIVKWWSERICEEFFQQGDEEQKRGMKISAFMDRSCPRVARSQVLFIDNIQARIWTLFSQIEPVPILLGHIRENRDSWSLHDQSRSSINVAQP
eukprot:m51a1_g7757 putative camp-specific 3 -cyclic phosphodiesterase 4b isoform x3 (750) ;mRNA; r:98534-101324